MDGTVVFPWVSPLLDTPPARVPPRLGSEGGVGVTLWRSTSSLRPGCQSPTHLGPPSEPHYGGSRSTYRSSNSRSSHPPSVRATPTYPCPYPRGRTGSVR